MIGSPRAYLSRNRSAIMWVSDYRYPIWTFSNRTAVIGYPRDFHVNYARFNGSLSSFQNLGKALRTFSLKRLWNYSRDYSLSCTPLGPITITNLAKKCRLFLSIFVKFLNPSYPAVKSRFLGGTFKYTIITDSLAVFLSNCSQVDKIALELQLTVYKLLKLGLVRDVFFSRVFYFLGF